jgi:hypothetical protein
MAGLTKGRAVWTACALALIICGICGASPRALAQGATDYPIPSTAAEAYGPIAEGFESPISPRKDLKGPKPHVDERVGRLKAQRHERWPSAPAFFRDTELTVESRTYWLGEDQFGFTEPKALTTGGSLAYESGYLADFFQLRSVLYTSQPLYANKEAGETDNLMRDGDQITTFGQLNGRMKVAGQEITAGRQLVRTPYVNPYDIRMIPLTFEGIVLLPENKDQKLNYTASYLTRYKPWDAVGFTPMSAGLGVKQDRGMLITGASYRTKSWNLGAANYWVNDVLNTAYGEIDHMWPCRANDDGPCFRTGINFLDQRTVGADLIAGGPYNTYQTSARLVASYRGFVFTGAVSETGDQADIQKPFGFSTSYTAMIITNFEQADVRAYMLALDYDFGRLGFEGVKFHAAWGKGNGTPNPVTNRGFADQDELDLRFAYEPHRGRLQGLHVEVEYIDWQVFDQPSPSDDLSQFRVIVNYKVPLL